MARTGDGTRLTPVAVNGWQQGWVVPAGTAGTITLTFVSNSLYRTGLLGGLALLPVLALLAWWPRGGGLSTTSPRGHGRRGAGAWSRSWQQGR
ncbi:putative membrane protein [Mycobacterium xenopi 3993]|nr:putative membrane protein [Mycobacterium xenopi 3993]